MTVETKEARKRRLERERKQKQRERNAASGITTIRFDVAPGTSAALERLKRLDGHETAELLTLMIHALDEITERDASRFKEFVTFERYAKAQETPCN